MCRTAEDRVAAEDGVNGLCRFAQFQEGKE